MTVLSRFAVLTFTLCVIFFTQPAFAQTFNAESFFLDNGMQVVVIENRRAPVVAHMVWYKYGAADEKPGESGIAHFLEHLLFKGTAKFPDGALSATVKKLGGNDNAFTSHDFTAYYQTVARQHLAKVMEMEADRMKNLRLSPNVIAAERQVIIEERRQRIDNQPQAKFNEQMMAALFVNHPYGVPVIGWLHEMKELTREMALNAYDRWYSPNNAILVVAGDINAEELQPLAKKYYGAIPVGEVMQRQRPRPAPIISTQRVILEDERVGVPLVNRIYRAPRGSDALDVLTEIFGGTSTSRLYRNLVVRDKIAVSAGAEYDPISLNETSFIIHASPAPGISAAKLEAAIEAEISALLESGVTLEELDAAKSRKSASVTYYLDSIQGPALIFGRALCSGFDIDYVQNRLKRIDALTIDDVNAAANNLLNGENMPVSGLLTQPLSPKRPSKPATSAAPAPAAGAEVNR